MRRIDLTRKKIFASFQNENAFTLVEILFTFLIFTMIIFFLSPLLHVMQQHNDLKTRLQTMEWDVFCSQIKKEIRISTKVQLVSNRLILTEDSGTITIEKYENILRRRVNSTGHEVLLQNVSEVNFTLMPAAIKIAVKDINHREYTVNIYSLVYGGGTP